MSGTASGASIVAAPWTKRPIKNILLDINGVLFNSGEEGTIEGSVEAMKRLVKAGFNFCLVTNECTTAKRLLAEKLNQLGYLCVTPDKIISPAPAACRYLIEHKLRPRLHVWDGVMEDFAPALAAKGVEEPNCLVVGDAMGKISRDYMDESLEIMLNCIAKNSTPPQTTESVRTAPQIVSLGAGRYYRDAGRLRMDTGAYVAAFEFSLGLKAINLGKPSAAFFQDALNIIGGTPEDTVMVGDDILSDVGGAQQMGMRGFLVRTGKYKSSDESGACGVIANQVFDNLSQAVDAFIAQL